MKKIIVLFVYTLVLFTGCSNYDVKVNKVNKEESNLAKMNNIYSYATMNIDTSYPFEVVVSYYYDGKLVSSEGILKTDGENDSHDESFGFSILKVNDKDFLVNYIFNEGGAFGSSKFDFNTKQSSYAFYSADDNLNIERNKEYVLGYYLQDKDNIAIPEDANKINVKDIDEGIIIKLKVE